MKKLLISVLLGTSAALIAYDEPHNAQAPQPAPAHAAVAQEAAAPGHQAADPVAEQAPAQAAPQAEADHDENMIAQEADADAHDAQQAVVAQAEALAQILRNNLADFEAQLGAHNLAPADRAHIIDQITHTSHAAQEARDAIQGNPRIAETLMTIVADARAIVLDAAAGDPLDAFVL